MESVVPAEVLRGGEFKARPVVRMKRSGAEKSLEIFCNDQVKDHPWIPDGNVFGLLRIGNILIGHFQVQIFFP